MTPESRSRELAAKATPDRPAPPETSTLPRGSVTSDHGDKCPLCRARDERDLLDSSALPMQTPPVLAIEDRLLVALASRGSLRLGQLLENVFGCSQDPTSHCLFYRSDQQIVASIEAWVAEHME